MARPLWYVDAGSVPAGLLVGDTVQIAHRMTPVETSVRVSGLVADFVSDKVQPAFEISAGSMPRVVIVNNSVQSEVEGYASASVKQTSDGNELTFLRADRKPFAFCAVTIDNKITRNTDGAGRVSFPASVATPGMHTFVIVTPEGQTFELQLPT